MKPDSEVDLDELKKVQKRYEGRLMDGSTILGNIVADLDGVRDYTAGQSWDTVRPVPWSLTMLALLSSLRTIKSATGKTTLQARAKIQRAVDVKMDRRFTRTAWEAEMAATDGSD